MTRTKIVKQRDGSVLDAVLFHYSYVVGVTMGGVEGGVGREDK